MLLAGFVNAANISDGANGLLSVCVFVLLGGVAATGGMAGLFIS